MCVCVCVCVCVFLCALLHCISYNDKYYSTKNETILNLHGNKPKPTNTYLVIVQFSVFVCTCLGVCVFVCGWVGGWVSVCVVGCVDINNQSVSRGQRQSQDEYKTGPVFPEVVIPPATE